MTGCGEMLAAVEQKSYNDRDAIWQSVIVVLLCCFRKTLSVGHIRKLLKRHSISLIKQAALLKDLERARSIRRKKKISPLASSTNPCFSHLLHHQSFLSPSSSP